MSTHSSGTRAFRAEFHDFRSEHGHSLKWHPIIPPDYQLGNLVTAALAKSQIQTSERSN